MTLSFSFSFLQLSFDDSFNILAKHFMIGTDRCISGTCTITKMRVLFSGTYTISSLAGHTYLRAHVGGARKERGEW